MKKVFCSLLAVFAAMFFVACGSNTRNAIELMGAGDRIHDTYTFANSGVKISNDDNIYTISGTVEKIENEAVKKEFHIDDDVDYVVAIKLSAVEDEVKESEVEINVDGTRAYDAEHLNGSDYTFVILDAAPSRKLTIKVKWNKEQQERSYIIQFSDDLKLK